jgi:hypothetical protein
LLTLAACAPITPEQAGGNEFAPSGSAAPSESGTPRERGTLSAQPATAIVAEESQLVLNTDNPIVLAAAKDLAKRLNVGLNDIAVISFEAVVWPDGGLGCPRPGMIYTQVQQDGARILLQVGGTVYQYHSGGSRGPFLCENPQEPPSSTGGGGE